MFGLGVTEVLLILAIALIIIGPQKLPEFGKTLGRALNEFKKGAQDFKRNLDIDSTLDNIKDIKNMTPTKSNLKRALKDAVLKDNTDSPPPETVAADAGSQNIEKTKSQTSSETQQEDAIFNNPETAKRTDQ
jgi:TatA/E family protein of Tat protein translocase